MGGIAMLTLSDTENNLHFILILQGLVKRKDKGGRGQRAPRHAGRRSKTTRILCWDLRNRFSLKLVCVGRAACGAHPSPARVPPARPEGNPSQHHLSRE